MVCQPSSILKIEKPVWISTDRYVILIANKPKRVAGRSKNGKRQYRGISFFAVRKDSQGETEIQMKNLLVTALIITMASSISEFFLPNNN